MRISLSKCLYAIAILTVIGISIYTLRGSQGIPALMKKQEEIKALSQRNAELAKENEARRVKIQRLRQNPEEQELEIRRQMKLVKPGEKVFILQDQDKKAAQ
jgi:cell division protein FtsB